MARVSMTQLVGSIRGMSDASRSSRTLTTLSDGAKWAMLAGIPLIALAIFFFTTNIAVSKEGGGLYYCGSAMSPNSEGKNICQPVENANRGKAMISLGTGLAIPLAGIALFGVSRRSQTARPDAEDEVDTRREARRSGPGFLDDEDLETTRASRRGERAARADDDFDDFDEFDDTRADRRRRDALDELDAPRSRRRGDDDWELDGRR